MLKASGQVGRHERRDRTLILLAYRHGLRVSELVAMRWVGAFGGYEARREGRIHGLLNLRYRTEADAQVNGPPALRDEAAGSVHLPPHVAHSMWEHYGQRADSELLVFHNHPYNPLNLLFDNVPLASRGDRIFLETRAMSAPQLVRLILNQGRVLFYLGENGFVKQFSLPSLVALLSRRNGGD